MFKSKVYLRFRAILLLQVIISTVMVASDLSNTTTLRSNMNGYRPSCSCNQCIDTKDLGFIKPLSTGENLDEKDIDIIVAFTDTYGNFKTRNVKSRDLSASWIWKSPTDKDYEQKTSSKVEATSVDNAEHSAHQFGDDTTKWPTSAPVNPVKLKRRILRQERKKLRSEYLSKQDKDIDSQMEAAAIQRTKEFDTTAKGRYSIWRIEYANPNSDSIVKLMHDQIIMAKAYATIAKAKNETGLYDSLLKSYRESRLIIEEANSDAELPPSALVQAKAMGHILSLAKDQLYDCLVVARKLRAMLISTETNVNVLKKKSAFLIQLAAKTLPKPLHCLSLQLTADYHLQEYETKRFPYGEKLEDPSLYHYAIFSDNVLTTSVVVNSTVQHAKEPEKHVFHIVTDKLNFAAMRMWFLVNPPPGVAIQVENVDDFSWLNSSYCPVLRQLESARMKDYYFKANQDSSISVGSDNLKYRNPKYLSMLNHLRFYLPEVYPKLKKVLFLDDDIVVQKDLTPLWSVDLHGMVNGAVETCKESFHRFDKYLNFSNPKISENFDPNSCGWAYGMNMFDLLEWRKQDITGIYHHWQEMNEDRTLWKLGTLPPGLITFYNLTHPLDRSWHALGLGYDPALNQTEIENAAVVHYNGNYKPWLDLAISKYRSYWSRHVMLDNSYLRLCKINY